MAVTAYKFPAVGVNVDRDGKNVWVNPTDVYSSNDARAYCYIGKATYSDWLRATGFGFTAGDIPAGSTIDGIEVKIERVADNANKVSDSALYLRKTSGQVGSNKASASTWPTTEDEATYGGAADTWAAGLTQADIVSADFGLDLSAYNVDADANQYARVDCYSIRVYYTDVAAQPFFSYYPHILAH